MIASTENQIERLTTDHEFRQSLRFSVGMFLFLAAIVLTQMFLGVTATFLMLIPFTAIICYYAYNDPFKGVMCYLCFTAVEGMYRYISYFAQWEYMLSPAYALIIVTIFLAKGKIGTNTGRRLPVIGAFMAAVVLGVVAIFNPLGCGIVGSTATFLVWYFIPMVMYPVVYFVKKKPGDAYLFCLVLIAVGVLVSTVQMIQYMQGSAWTQAHFPGIEKTMNANVNYVDSHGLNKLSFRPASTTAIGGGAGMWARLSVIAAFVLFTVLEKKFVTRLFLLIFGGIGVLGVFLCGTRIFMVFVVADFLFCSLYYATTIKSLQKSLFIVAMGLVLIRISFSVSETITGGFVSERFEKLFADPVTAYQSNRKQAIPNAVLTASSYPLGIGYTKGVTTRGQFESGVHFGPGIGDRESQFGAYVADVGVPGLVTYIFLVFSMIIVGVRQARRMRQMSLRLIACIGPSLLTGGFIVWFAAPIMQGYCVYWIAMALTFSLTEGEMIERERKRRVWESQKKLALAPPPAA